MEHVTVEQFKTVLETMAALEETLKGVKTEGERIEAIERQLEDATRINDENAANTVPIFGDTQNVAKDIFHDRMTEKEISTALTSPTEDSFVHEFQRRADEIKIYCEILGKKPSELKIYKDWEKFCEKGNLSKALTVVGSPASWVPQEWSSEIAIFYRQALRVATAFDQFEQPSGTFPWPFIGTGFEVHGIGEPTADPPSNIPRTDPSQSSIILTAKTFGGRMFLSEELEEDALGTLVPRLREVVIPRGDAEAVEDAIINGDTAATHQDSFTFAANDRRKLFLGVRAIAIDESATYNTQETTIGAAAYEYDDFIETLVQGNNGLMTEPSEGVWFMSNKAYLRSAKFDELRANAQLAQQLTSPVMNGVVNFIEGRPVIVSSKYPENMDANGVVTGGTLTGFTCVNRTQFIIGNRRQQQIDMEFDIEARLWKLVITRRMSFTQLLPTGNNTCVSGINV